MQYAWFNGIDTKAMRKAEDVDIEGSENCVLGESYMGKPEWECSQSNVALNYGMSIPVKKFVPWHPDDDGQTQMDDHSGQRESGLITVEIRSHQNRKINLFSTADPS